MELNKELNMEYQKAVEKGFMNLEEKEMDEVLGNLFNEEDPQTVLDRSLELFLTFIPEEKADAVLDLAYIIHESYYELGKFDEEVDEEEGEFDVYDGDTKE
jgi:hypothetical protein